MDAGPLVGGPATPPDDAPRLHLGLVTALALAVISLVGVVTETEAPATTPTSVTTTTIRPIEGVSNLVPSALTWRTTDGLDGLVEIHDLVGVGGSYQLVGGDRHGLLLASSEDGAVWIDEAMPEGLDGGQVTDAFYQALGDVLVLGVGESPSPEPRLWWRTGVGPWTAITLPAGTPSTVTGLAAIGDEVVVTGLRGPAMPSGPADMGLPEAWGPLMASGQAYVSFEPGGGASLWIGRHRVATDESVEAPATAASEADAVGWIGSPAEGFDRVPVPGLFKVIGNNASGDAFGVTAAGRLMVAVSETKWDDLELATGYVSDGVVGWADGWMAAASPTGLSYSTGAEWMPRGPRPFPSDAVLRNLSASEAGVAAIMDRTSWLERTGRVDVPSVEGYRVRFDMASGVVVQSAGLRSLAEIGPGENGLALDGAHLVVSDPLTGEPVARIAVEDWNEAWADSLQPRPDEVAVAHSFDGQSWSVLSVDSITGSQSSQARSVHLAGEIGLLIADLQPSVWLATWEAG